MIKYSGALNSKLPKVGTTIFTVMSALANKHKAINLSQGFPDFPVSSELISLVNKYMKKGYNQYAPMQGVPRLRQVISEKIMRCYNLLYNAEQEINITAGATQAIYTAITAVVHEGDEVIIFTPAYDCYEPAIKLCGATPVFVPLKTPDYHIDWHELKKRINHSTRMIIINSPHNPTGAVLSASDLKELDKITQDSDIIVLSDEVYEHIIFDDNTHQSVARFPSLASHSFIVASFGKTFHATGWKMGYVVAPKKLMEEFRKSHQFVVFTCNTPMQYALADYLENEDNYLQLGDFYQKKRDLFLSGIKKSKFKPIRCEGTYFQLLNYDAISAKDDVEFAEKLTMENGIASIPVSVFYNEKIDNHVLRFCFAKREETIIKATQLLCAI